MLAPVPAEGAGLSQDEKVVMSTIERIAALAIHFWKSLMAALAAGYQAGFLWVAAVGIYLLLRRDIDGAEMNEVFIDEQDEYGLPPLADDPATGVPEIAPSELAPPGDTGPSTPPAGA